MSSRKCCVSGCNSTNKTHRLFNIPKNDKLRELWLSFLIPNNVKLSGLSKEQLVSKLVCQNHFDRYQYDIKGDRLQHGYPSLFTSNEILHGIPLSSSNEHHLSHHNYCVQTVTEDSIKDPTTIIEETTIIEGDHSYADRPGSQVPVPMEINLDNTMPMEVETTGYTKNLQHKIRAIRQPHLKIAVPKSANKTNMLSKSRSFIRRMKDITESCCNKTFEQKIHEARNLCNTSFFLKNFVKLSKQAQDFIMMQLRLVNKNKKGYRYTTDDKLMALALMKESPKGYRLLKKMFTMPSKRTLNRLAEKVDFGVGLNDNIFSLLKQTSANWDTKKRLCSIVFDEVALTPHLTYVESKDNITGFKNLGDVREMKFADHSLVFMLRGVCSNWRQPICYYFCEGTTSSASVKRILKEVVAKVSQSGLIPIALVCDQGSTFRSALKMLREETERKIILNNEHNDGTIEISGQHLSVIYDPPHLLKGLRNNLLTKNMIFKGNIASWNDILTVYRTDCQLGHTRMNKKLTDHHVISDKIKKMKVNLAAQVLSAQTSAMLKYTSLFDTTACGEKVSPTMATTGEAVEFIDKLFDSVNGSQRSSVKGKLRGPIKPTSQHFNFWHEARHILKNVKFVDSTSKRAMTNKKQYHVRVPSLDGWIVTLESFERIAKLLFEKYNCQYFYPRNINQDPLENFFGRIRAINYRNVNPDSYTFTTAFKSLLISNVMGPHSMYSNCEDDQGQTIIDFFNLTKNNERNLPVAIEEENIPVDVNIAGPSRSISQSVLCQSVLKVVDTNIPVLDVVSQSNNAVSQLTNAVSQLKKVDAIKEKVKVHSSAYTAGYLCRRLSKKFNCGTCRSTYTTCDKQNFHKWIETREYRQLKNSNLAYPSSRFLILYRDISDLIHEYLNCSAHKSDIGKKMENNITNKFNLHWLGCTTHRTHVINFYVKLILRIHIHNWCNILNKILKGAIGENSVKKMNAPQMMAFNKYKAHRLRNKNK